MDFSLNDDQQAYADSARAFARGVFAPNAARWDAEHHFPKAELRQAGDLGFMGMYTPEHAGGLNMPRLDASIIIEELASGCTSTAAFVSIHNMATAMIGKYATAQIIDQWAGRLVTGEILASYCLTEPGAGSDAASLQSTAVRDGDDFIVNGSKVFISGAGETDVLVAMLRSGGEGAGGISAFMIPATLPGISYGKNEEKMGWRSQPTRMINFENVRVPAVNLLGSEGQGFKIAMEGLDGGRINIAACSVGTAQTALEEAIAYVGERRQFGKAVAEFQVTQFKLADMATDLVAARQMVRLAASKLDSGAPEAGTYCAMAKRFATDAGFRICNQALQLFGGYGYIREYPMERHVRDVRVHQILEGTNEIMSMIIGRRLLIDGITELLR